MSRILRASKLRAFPAYFGIEAPVPCSCRSLVAKLCTAAARRGDRLALGPITPVISSSVSLLEINEARLHSGRRCQPFPQRKLSNLRVLTAAAAAAVA